MSGSNENSNKALQSNMEENGNKKEIKKRGSKQTSVTAYLKGDKEDIARIIKGSVQFLKQPIVKSDEECAQRLSWFFDMCAENGQIPTVEDMCLALGTTRMTVNRWEHGVNCSENRSYQVKRAKEILAAIDAKLVSEGRIPQVTYIFRAKNFFGMKDQQDVVVTPNNPMGLEGDQAALAEKYKAAVEVDD